MNTSTAINFKRLLGFNGKQEDAAMPTSIFYDLSTNDEMAQYGWNHSAIAFGYYYLINWLYFNCLYLVLGKITTTTIRQILGLTANDKFIFIIKDGGLLDELGYTLDTTDLPIKRVQDENDVPIFNKLSDAGIDLKVIDKKNYNSHIKLPVKSLHKSILSKVNGIFDGAFYNKTDSFLVAIEAFIFCMKNRKIGIAGFYLYSYLTAKTDNGECELTLTIISEETGIDRNDLIQYLFILMSHRMIYCNKRENDSFDCGVYFHYAFFKLPKLEHVVAL